MEDLKCPYCDSCVDEYLEFDSSDDTLIHECNECGEEFEITVEYNPEYFVSKIEYTNCDQCGKKINERASFEYKNKKFCERCLWDNFKKDKEGIKK